MTLTQENRIVQYCIVLQVAAIASVCPPSYLHHHPTMTIIHERFGVTRVPKAKASVHGPNERTDYGIVTTCQNITLERGVVYDTSLVQ